MPQILKEEIKERIVESAKQEFLENSYEKTSMRNIANKSNITVGNLYRYFKNKEELSSFIVGPTLQKIQNLVLELTNNQIDIMQIENISLTVDQLKLMLDKLGDGLVDIYMKHRVEANILMMRNEVNTRLTSWFSDAIAQIISANYNIDSSSDALKLVSATYAESIFKGLTYMLRNNKLDTVSLKKLVKLYMESYVDMLGIDFIQQLMGE